MDLGEFKRRERMPHYLDAYGGVGTIRAWEVLLWSDGDPLLPLTNDSEVWYLHDRSTQEGGASFGVSPK